MAGANDELRRDLARERAAREIVDLALSEAIAQAAVWRARAIELGADAGEWQEDGLQRPLLQVIDDELVARGWKIEDALYVSPEGERYGNVEGAVTAQSFREIGRA